MNQTNPPQISAATATTLNIAARARKRSARQIGEGPSSRGVSGAAGMS
jgi:hypothetical protein